MTSENHPWGDLPVVHTVVASSLSPKARTRRSMASAAREAEDSALDAHSSACTEASSLRQWGRAGKDERCEQIDAPAGVGWPSDSS